MNCNQPEVSAELLMLLDDELSDDRHVEAMKHLNECTSCRKEYEDLSEARAILMQGASQIKKRWVHPSPEDLVHLVNGDDEISPEKRNQLRAHLRWCESCSDEFALLIESPDFSEFEDVSEESVEMPKGVLEAFRDVYGSSPVPSSVGPVHSRPISVSFIDRLKEMFLLTPRHAFAVAVLLIILAFSSGVMLSPSYIAFRNSRTSGIVSNFSGKYIPCPVVGVSDQEVDEMLESMREQGVTAHKRDGKIWIRDDQLESAFAALVRYQQMNRGVEGIRVVTGENPPSRMIATGVNPMSTSSPGIVPGSSDLDQMDQWFARIHPDELSMVSASPGRGVSPSPQVTRPPSVTRREIFPETGGILAVTFPGEVELFHSLRRSGSYPQSLNDSRNNPDAMNLHFEALNSASSLLGADMKEREMDSVRIQNTFREKAVGVLKKHSMLEDALLYVTVSLDFERNNFDVYPIRVVKLTIITRQQVPGGIQDEVRREIMKALDWRSSWQGGIEFATP